MDSRELYTQKSILVCMTQLVRYHCHQIKQEAQLREDSPSEIRVLKYIRHSDKNCSCREHAQTEARSCEGRPKQMVCIHLLSNSQLAFQARKKHWDKLQTSGRLVLLVDQMLQTSIPKAG
jgi:hypothetical protein